MRISLTDVTIQAGNQLAFDHTTWTLEAGQHWAILGPNGSGKSTLVKAINQDARLRSGQIRYFFEQDGEAPGRSYLEPNEVLTFSAETHQSFLRRFAGYHQARWQSFEGEEAPVVGQLLSGADSAAAQAAVEMFHLHPLMERQVHLLSHGESRKVFLARLLARSPRLLILDDPFTGLDRDSRTRLSEGIERMLRQQEPAVLFVGARVEDLPAGISHVLLVRGHRIVAQGERKSVLSQLAPAGEASQPADEDPGISPTFERMALDYASRLGSLPPGEAPALVQMQDVTVRYEDTSVLDNLSWTVRQGERWALLGPNGAGKTTLLSLILADNPQAYRNDIRLFEKRRGSGESIWEIKARIGWVSPELHAFYPRTTTALEVICSGFFDSVGLYRRCNSSQRETGAGWADALGIGALSERPFHALSTGEQRLVLLCRALVKAPPLLVLDEPCQGLDEQHRARFVALVDQICARTPVTLIYVTHDPAELPQAITHQFVLS
jgi:molybdate transport system ATP-binding protein